MKADIKAQKITGLEFFSSYKSFEKFRLLSKIAIFSTGFLTRTPTISLLTWLKIGDAVSHGELFQTQNKSHEVWWKKLAKCVLGQTDGWSGKKE
jgi:hypothetical protein